AQVSTLVGTLAGLIDPEHERAASGGRLRVDADAVDALVDQLAMTLAEVEGISAGSDPDDLALRLDRLAARVRRLHRLAADLHLVHAGMVIQAVELAAQDAARALGRTVQVETIGGDTLIDAQVAAVLRDALPHIVRNAVAHGIEAPAQRAAAGKPEAGQIRLTIERRASRLTVACRDDGGGIDPVRVRDAAVRANVIDADAALAMSDAQALQLVFRGGVSTADRVGAIAGRGVGLEAVQEAAALARGSVRIETALGEGTTVTLTLPVALAHVLALEVEADGEKALIPLETVVHTVRLAPEQWAEARRLGAITHAGSSLRLAWLPRLLRPRREGAVPPAASVVVTRSGARTLAIAVEHIHGVREAIVRPLPAGIAAGVVDGVAIEANGAATPVLRPFAVDGATTSLLPPEPQARTRQRVLVIDDSLTTRMLEQSILSGAGYACDVASSAEEGLRLARSRPYSLLLVDIEMPGMDGFGFLDAKRADSALAGVPAVMVSSLSAPEHRQRAKAAGARGFIVKGQFDQDRFLALVRDLAGPA
nr:response regulator [Planctomycetota bacterium]